MLSKRLRWRPPWAPRLLLVWATCALGKKSSRKAAAGAAASAAAEPPPGAEVEIVVEESSEDHGRRHMRPEDIAAAAQALNNSGFVILRKGLLFSEAELEEAYSAAKGSLSAAQKAMVKRDLGDEPWFDAPRRAVNFRDARSYSSGRLDMPLLLGTGPFGAWPWRQHPDLLEICGQLFRANCSQSVLGALWNFAGADGYMWHRDGQNRLLVVIVALRDYPADAGWMQVQPNTHWEGSFIHADQRGTRAPRAGEPPAVSAVLRKGEIFIFQYSVKHAATPNPSDHHRCLLYSIYGKVGEEDTHNHNTNAPRLLPQQHSEL